MARYPGATWRPLPENATEPLILVTQGIFHSGVTKADSLWSYFARRDIVVESHFYVQEDGDCEQYIDTTRQADANYRANVRAASIETWDNGDPDRVPWNDRQLDRLVDWAVWLHLTHGVPLRLAPAWNQPGFGGHTLYPEWSNVRKTCPGLARRGQVPLILERARAVLGGGAPAPAPTLTPAPTGDDMDQLVARWGYLKTGSSGQGVRLWQGLLVAMGRSVTVDGAFGPGTDRATRDWQAAAGVPGGADGVVGANTWGRALGVR